MNIHPEARTTPKIRAEIQASTLGVKALAKKYNISVSTVRKWKSRQAVQDRSHCPHHLQTTLSSLSNPEFANRDTAMYACDSADRMDIH